MEEAGGELRTWSFVCADCGRSVAPAATSRTQAAHSLRLNGWDVAPPTPQHTAHAEAHCAGCATAAVGRSTGATLSLDPVA